MHGGNQEPVGEVVRMKTGEMLHYCERNKIQNHFTEYLSLIDTAAS